MEQVTSVEAISGQRLNALVYSYTLLIKHLMEEGVELAKVKRASDKVWAVLGSQAAEQLKPFFKVPVDIEALMQAGRMAADVYGIEVNEKIKEKEIHSEFLKCPWQDAYIALGIPEEWRLCPSGHVAFTDSMYRGLNPDAKFYLKKAMPSGARICEARTTI